MEIKKEYYVQIDKDLRDKYKKFVGVEPDDISVQKFSLLEQIIRYAKNLAFWYIEDISINDIKKVNGFELAKKYIVSNALIEVNKSIDKKFNNSVKKQIYDQANIYYNLYKFDINFLDKIENIRNDMEKFGKESERLYNLAKYDSCDTNNELLNPTNWLVNQTGMRKSWEKFRNSFDDALPIFKQTMLSNSFSKYMQYMYDTYPDGFGSELLKFKDSNRICDGAEIYYILKNKINTNDIYLKNNIPEDIEDDKTDKLNEDNYNNNNKNNKKKNKKNKKKKNKK